MVIGVDIDGVLRDLVSSAISLYNREFGKNMEPKDWKIYDTDKQFPEIREAKGCSAAKWFFQENGHFLFRESKPIGNVSDLIRRLRFFGNVVIISYQKSYENKMDTLHWLAYNEIECDGVCFVDDKSIVKLDYLIDDNPEYLFKSGCDHAILISAPYNYGCEFDDDCNRTIERYNSLEEFVKYIEKCYEK